MKRKFVILVAIMMVSGFVQKTQAQRGNKDENFYFSLGPGIAFNAPGKNISINKPTLGVEVGYKPTEIKYFLTGVKMWALVPYSPVTRYSIFQGDSLNPSWKYRYDKTATLIFIIGVSGGEEIGFTGGMNTGFGASFIEINNKLGAFPVWNFTLEGGVNISKKVAFLISSTYSYLFKNGSMLKSDGFAVGLELKCRFKF